MNNCICDSPCYTVDMTCEIDGDILMSAGLPPNDNFRVMMQDAFGNKRISDPVTSDAEGAIIIPQNFFEDWVDLGAQLTLTILDDEENVALELQFGDVPGPYDPVITCVLLIFTTDGAVDIK